MNGKYAFQAWEDKLMRLERMEAQLNMPGVQRCGVIIFLKSGL